MKALDKPSGKEGLTSIQEISTFQGKCEVLRDSFFPANVATPLPPGQLATPTITAAELQTIL